MTWQNAILMLYKRFLTSVPMVSTLMLLGAAAGGCSTTPLSTTPADLGATAPADLVFVFPPIDLATVPDLAPAGPDLAFVCGRGHTFLLPDMGGEECSSPQDCPQGKVCCYGYGVNGGGAFRIWCAKASECIPRHATDTGTTRFCANDNDCTDNAPGGYWNHCCQFGTDGVKALRSCQ